MNSSEEDEDAPVELAEEYALPGEGPDRVDRDIPGKHHLEGQNIRKYAILLCQKR